MEYYGYAGKILIVDLSSKKVFAQDLSLDLAKTFSGDVALALSSSGTCYLEV